jgi:tetratricopeptide (TPR) repeat protein
VVVLLAPVLFAWPVPARAQSEPDTTAAPSSATAGTDSSAEARPHFDKARELYRTGAYREAIRELEVARTLDPNGKELVYNLAVVHEKLGEIAYALRELRAYQKMDLTPSERDKAESYQRRLEGARREIAPVAPVAPASPDALAQPEAPPTSADEKGSRGRLDGATLTAGGVMLVGIAVGTAFGIKALADRPTGFVTGQDGSFADFQHRNDVAHGEAIVADASFGVGIVAAVVTAILYFARDSAPDAASTSSVSASWLGGGHVGWRGTF